MCQGFRNSEVHFPYQLIRSMYETLNKLLDYVEHGSKKNKPPIMQSFSIQSLCEITSNCFKWTIILEERANSGNEYHVERQLIFKTSGKSNHGCPQKY